VTAQSDLLTRESFLRKIQVTTMDEINQILKQRRQKAIELEELGGKLYSNHFRPSHHLADLLQLAGQIPTEAPEDAGEYRPTFRIAGRITGMRKFGKAAFLHVQDETDRLQVYVKNDGIGPEMFARFKKWDIGDIAGFEGKLFKTKTGELTLNAENIVLITKSLRPLPEKFHGLTDVETRYRQRYVDLIVNPEVRTTFKKRIEIIRLIREFLANRGFLEVETPMMQAVPGGATARPFKTYHNSLDMNLFLRVAPELYLKRLLVGGFEKVFEINRNFRNEGLSTRHNPEFTMLEFYQAYATYDDLMELTEEMIPWLAKELNSTMAITYQGQSVNLAPPWKRYTIDEALLEIGGIAQEILNDAEKIIKTAKEKGVLLDDKAGPGKAKTELFELLVEEKLINPTFVTAYPTEVSPLARRNEKNPQVTDRFELFITGREIANAFSELNDPLDQKKRFERQIADRGNDEEIHPVLDEDYIRALEYGLPAAAGEGIGIDRLVMLLTDSPSIRDVILFPHLKPERS
jgi:lysyl-tRNA synthetase class 2